MKKYKEVAVTVCKEYKKSTFNLIWYCVYNEDSKLIGLGITRWGALRDAKRTLSKKKEKNMKDAVIRVRI